MTSSFRKRGPGLQGPAQLRNLLSVQSPGGKLFQGAESNPIGLTQGAIDGPGFGHAHLGVVEDERGDIAGMGITIAHEAAAVGGLIDGGLEDPEVLLGMAEGKHGFDVDTSAVVSFGHSD
jgi:hypothetical protein